MSDEFLIQADLVSKKFCRDLKRSLWYGLSDLIGEIIPRPRAAGLRPGEFWAVDGVSFTVRRGEALGLIGRNGAGKTTLLRILTGLLKPDQGRVTIRGRVAALIALGAGFNPVLTGRENIYVNAAVLGLTKRETDERLDSIIGFADIGEFIDAPVQSYSSGMQVKLGFAVATALDPDVLILDEILAVGDAAFRAKCYSRIGAMREKAAVIFVSHSMEMIAQVCDRALVLSEGREVHFGDVATGVEQYERANLPVHDAPESFGKIDPRLSGVRVSLEPPEVRYGAALGLMLEFESSDTIDGAFLKVLVYDASGLICADWSSRWQGTTIRIERGRTQLRVCLNSMHLRNGRYHLAINLHDGTGVNHLIWSYKVESFTVSGQATSTAAYALPRGVIEADGASMLRSS